MLILVLVIILREAIEFAWEFLTEVLKLDKDNMDHSLQEMMKQKKFGKIKLE